MIDTAAAFIAAHWWTWPLLYAAPGALLYGLFTEETSTKGLLPWLAFWPYFLLAAIGNGMRE